MVQPSSVIDSSEDTTAIKLPPSNTEIARKLGIGVALLEDPVYGVELKEIFRLYREGRITEAQDKLAISQIGQLNEKALNRVILKAEKSKVYQESLKEFGVKIRQVLAPRGIQITEQQIKDYFDRGTDEDVIIDELIGGIGAKTAAGTSGNALTVLRTIARNNGFDLDKDFSGQVDGWLQRIQRGEDIEDFKRLIRAQAKLGLPEKVGALIDQGLDLSNIYAPYRTRMANLLELTPDSISLDDPLLRSAYAGDKEMSLYDFQRAVRKDPRWQYTDNAREETSNVALKILQDFGFQG
jgi:hypothetical protein